MEIIEILEKKLLTISFRCTLQSANYTILKQENVVADNDNLITGIYFNEYFRYIICCHRDEKILDYTRFSHSEEHAQKLYKEMIQEIQKDLER